MPDVNRIGQFDVVPAKCGSPLHDATDRRTVLCVRIGSIPVCEDCVREYASDFDEAVEEWTRHEDTAAALMAVESIVRTGWERNRPGNA